MGSESGNGPLISLAKGIRLKSGATHPRQKFFGVPPRGFTPAHPVDLEKKLEGFAMHIWWVKSGLCDLFENRVPVEEIPDVQPHWQMIWSYRKTSCISRTKSPN